MCSEPLYALRLKTKYDKRFKRFKKRTPLKFLGAVRKYESEFGFGRPYYDKEHYDLIVISCGQCWHCRLQRSKRKAIQCVTESYSHQNNSFVTLTFSYDKLYEYFRTKEKLSYYLSKKMANFCCWSLENDLVTKFIKKLRQFYYNRELGLWLLAQDPINNQKYVYNEKGEFKEHIRVPKELKAEFMPKIKIRYYRVGEYGSKKGRPHHHILFFGINFAEFGSLKRWYSPNKENKEAMYTSDVLDKLWNLGIATVQGVGFTSCAYVARYTTKKVYGDCSEEFYAGRKPEFSASSNRRGLGYDYAVKNYKELLNNGNITINSGKKLITCGIPKYFIDLCKVLNPDLYYQYQEKCVDRNNLDLDKLFKYKSSIYTDLNSKNKKAMRCLKELTRGLESQDLGIESFIYKAKANGIDENVAILLGDSINDKCKNWKEFRKRSTSEVMRNKYKQFENDRRRLINSLYTADNDKSYADIENDVLFLKRIDNPYKLKKRGYQYYEEEVI